MHNRKNVNKFDFIAVKDCIWESINKAPLYILMKKRPHFRVI